MVEIAGQHYVATVGSDVRRGGMFLEVLDAAQTYVAEVFYHDRDHRMTFTAYQPDLPLALVEWIASHARERLIPAKGGGD